jgi:hypothetical protein
MDETKGAGAPHVRLRFGELRRVEQSEGRRRAQRAIEGHHRLDPCSQGHRVHGQRRRRRRPRPLRASIGARLIISKGDRGSTCIDSPDDIQTPRSSRQAGPLATPPAATFGTGRRSASPARPRAPAPPPSALNSVQSAAHRLRSPRTTSPPH